MFETLFARPSVIARYRQGPFAEAREQFLQQCAERGYSRSMLQKMSWILLAVAHRINIDKAQVTPDEIAAAVDERRRFKHSSEPQRNPPSSRSLFVHIASEWVRSLGRLAPIPEIMRPFSAEVAAFARNLRDERGLSSVTIATRCERLAWFFQSLHPPRDSLRTISVRDVDAFIEAMAKKGWTRLSLSSLTSSLRSFFQYAEGQGWCSEGLTAVIESPRIYALEGLPEAPSWEVVQRLLESARGDKPADIRDYPILLLLAVYGLRRGEVAGLTLDDLDWPGERIAVPRSKRRCTERYPLLPELAEALLRYLREVRRPCAHRALFLSLSAPIRPLSAYSISPIVRSRLTGLGANCSPRGAHCLRHACARHLLASGFSLKEIGDHLGHRTANATLTYTKVDLNALREVAEFNLGGLL